MVFEIGLFANDYDKTTKKNHELSENHKKIQFFGQTFSYSSLNFFQAILFYVPRWLWKNWEAGKISALRMDLNLGIISEVEKKLKKKLLIDYLYSNLKHHNFWAYRYIFCEFLALVNIVGEYWSTRPDLQSC